MEPVYEGEGEERQPTGEFVDSGYIGFIEATVVGSLTPEKVANIRKEEVDIYDKSDAVNALYVNGKQMWYGKVDRTCINYSMQVEKSNGEETTTLYDNDGVAYVLPIDTALELFAQLELYAKACYNKTQEHKDNLASLETVEEILAYDITADYPEKLNITL